MQIRILLFILSLSTYYPSGNFLGLFGNREERKKAIEDTVKEVLTPTREESTSSETAPPPPKATGNLLSTVADVKTASRLMELSALSYKSPENIQAALAPLGFTQWRFFTAPGMDGQAFATWNSKAAILTFRGTEPTSWKDFVTDARFQLVNWQGDGKVHRGFSEAFEELWNQAGLENFMESHSNRPWVLTGHSMGAGLATLAASRYSHAHSLWTFGSPRSGNRAFTNSLDMPVFRYVNQADPVVDIPPYIRGMDSFDHAGKLQQITDNFQIQTHRQPNILSTRMSLGALMGGGFGGGRWDEELKKGIAQHMPQAYLQSLNQVQR